MTGILYFLVLCISDCHGNSKFTSSWCFILNPWYFTADIVLEDLSLLYSSEVFPGHPVWISFPSSPFLIILVWNHLVHLLFTICCICLWGWLHESCSFYHRMGGTWSFYKCWLNEWLIRFLTNCPLKGKVDAFSLCLGCALVNFGSVISPFISFLTCWLGTKMYYITSHIVLRNEVGEPNSGCMIRKILWLGKLSGRVKRDFYICIFQTLCFK